jgi:hypothetical protein
MVSHQHKRACSLIAHSEETILVVRPSAQFFGKSQRATLNRTTFAQKEDMDSKGLQVIPLVWWWLRTCGRLNVKEIAWTLRCWCHIECCYESLIRDKELQKRSINNKGKLTKGRENSFNSHLRSGITTPWFFAQVVLRIREEIQSELR